MRSWVIVTAVMFAAIAFAMPMAAVHGSSNPPTVSLTLGATTPTLGAQIPLTATFNLANNTTVYFFTSDTSVGTTQIMINGRQITVPLGGAVLSGIERLRAGTALSVLNIPQNPAVIGERRFVVAIAITGGGQASATPIASSGPILGDDIA